MVTKEEIMSAQRAIRFILNISVSDKMSAAEKLKLAQSIYLEDVKGVQEKCRIDWDWESVPDWDDDGYKSIPHSLSKNIDGLRAVNYKLDAVHHALALT